MLLVGAMSLAGMASVAAADETAVALAGSHATAADLTWDQADEIAIQLADGASSAGRGVTVAGDTLTITEPGTYRISGSLGDGQLIVDAASDGVVRLVLDGVDISSSSTAAIAAMEADTLVVILADGSQNTLTDAATYVYPSADVDEPDGALFSAADLTIAGDGALTVTGRAGDAIVGKDGLVIAGGQLSVSATDDGIRGKDYLVVEGGIISVEAGGDALRSTNEDDASLGYVRIIDGSLELSSGSDAIDAYTAAVIDGGSLAISAADDAIHAEGRLEIHGGVIDVASSYEGLEATQIIITDGETSIVASDDGLNVAGGTDAATEQAPGRRGGGMGDQAIEGFYVDISGGSLVIDAEGDGFDSNGAASVSGGTVVINGPRSGGNGAIDVNGEFDLSNAVLVAAGSVGMDEAPDATTGQATLHLRFDSEQAAGTIVQIRAEDGSVVLTYEAPKVFQSLVVSSPDIVAGATYEVLTGGSVSGSSLGGLFVDAADAGGTVLGTVTASES
jgi:hypothetical protein